MWLHQEPVIELEKGIKKIDGCKFLEFCSITPSSSLFLFMTSRLIRSPEVIKLVK
jgi:hypothetical protein